MCIYFVFFILCMMRGAYELVRGMKYKRLKERDSVWGGC